ncbi:unnamed protein product [Hermetia illucens]|uniref:Tetraspanin n=1 Tax=Hermetia illucens TaxID=343691 RepID=A0A7R8YPG0_HERIL|nr:23 kDa integral membrane protein [Hermetia illucens]CAD7077351.1 unnamed protein product [Hermetia illucens]
MTTTKRVKCFKHLVYSYVVLLTVTGAAQIILGAALLWGHVGYYAIVQNKFWAPSLIILILGPVSFMLCWLGCQATNQKNRCLLGVFSGVLVFAICVQFVICGWSLAMRETLPSSVEIYVDESFATFLEKRYKADNLHIWNRMQSQLQCCGVDGPLDYRRLAIPWSCCSRPEDPFESVCKSHYQRGCLAVLTAQLKNRLLYACAAAFAIAIIQIIGVVCALQLGYILSKDDARDDISAVARRQKDALQLSIYEKSRRDLPPPMGPVSPTAPGHRLLKTAPPPPPSMMPK